MSAKASKRTYTILMVGALFSVAVANSKEFLTPLDDGMFWAFVWATLFRPYLRPEGSFFMGFGPAFAFMFALFYAIEGGVAKGLLFILGSQLIMLVADYAEFHLRLAQRAHSGNSG